MAIDWVNFSNGDTLNSIRTNINNFNNSVVTGVNTNATNINTNANIIGIVSTLVNEYKVNQVSGLSTTSSIYSPANSLIIAGATPGTYEITLSMLFSYSNTTNSAFFRFSRDGGVSWREVRQESKDLTDNVASTYITTAVHSSGDLGVQVEYRTEAEGDVLTVATMDIIIDKKL